MAEIFSIPVRDQTFHTAPAGVVEQSSCSLSRPVGIPDELWYAVESVHHMDMVKAVDYREIEVPATMADFGIGVALTCDSDTAGGDTAPSRVAMHGVTGEQQAPAAQSPLAGPSGWIMILYSRKPRLEWDSQWRCVGFFTTEIAAQEHDSLTAGMFMEAMTAHLSAAETDSVRGTVTLTQNQSFGVIEQDQSCGCEIRVSWTPAGMQLQGLDAGQQVRMWARFIKDMAS
jgi:hypothetical protein